MSIYIASIHKSDGLVKMCASGFTLIKLLFFFFFFKYQPATTTNFDIFCLLEIGH